MQEGGKKLEESLNSAIKNNIRIVDYEFIDFLHPFVIGIPFGIVWLNMVFNYSNYKRIEQNLLLSLKQQLNCELVFYFFRTLYN